MKIQWRFLYHGICARLSFGSLAKIQIYGQLWAKLLALVPTGKNGSTTRQQWLEPVTKIASREWCSPEQMARASPPNRTPNPSLRWHKTQFNSPKPALVHAPSIPQSSKPYRTESQILASRSSLCKVFVRPLCDLILFCHRKNSPWFKWPKVNATSIMNKSQETNSKAQN